MILASVTICILSQPALALAAWPLDTGGGVGVGYQQPYTAPDGHEYVHRGIDCLGEAGSQVMAPIAGTVSFCGQVPAADGCGQATQTAISLELAGGQTLSLMPIDQVHVQEGQHVAQGQVLGTLAAQGDRSSSQPHVHVGLRQDGRYLDPSALLGLLPTTTSSQDEQEVPTVVPVPAVGHDASLDAQAQQTAWGMDAVLDGIVAVQQVEAQTGEYSAAIGDAVPAQDGEQSLASATISSGSVANVASWDAARCSDASAADGQEENWFIKMGRQAYANVGELLASIEAGGFVAAALFVAPLASIAMATVCVTVLSRKKRAGKHSWEEGGLEQRMEL